VFSHLSPVHTSNNVEATLSNNTMSNVASIMLQFLDNNVEATCDFVAKTATLSKQQATGNFVACCFDNVASTLLLVWTRLYNARNRPESKARRIFVQFARWRHRGRSLSAVSDCTSCQLHTATLSDSSLSKLYDDFGRGPDKWCLLPKDLSPAVRIR